MTTPILSIAEVAQGQSNKETTINNATRALEEAMNAALVTVVTTTVNISGTNAARNFAHRFTGTSGPQIVNFPAKARFLLIDNQTNGDLTIQVTGGAGDAVVVPTLTALLVFTDGTDFILVSAAAGSGGPIDAVDVDFTPSGGMASTNVQAAILEAYLAAGGGGGGGGDVPVYAPAIAANFTKIMSGVTTGSITDQTGAARDGVLLKFDAGGSSDRTMLASVTPPGATFQMDARFHVPAANGNFRTLGLYCKDATGKIASWGVSAAAQLNYITWSAIATYNSQTASSIYSYDSDVFMRVTRDGSNMQFWVSNDGVNYVLVHSVSNISYVGTPTEIGVFWCVNQSVGLAVDEFALVKEFEVV